MADPVDEETEATGQALKVIFNQWSATPDRGAADTRLFTAKSRLERDGPAA